MKLIPAIHLLGGRVVTLRKGRRDRATALEENPVELAREFAAGGASSVLIVDLDGAFTGQPANETTISAVARAVSIPLIIGGGIRNRAALDRALANGAAAVVMGTASVKDPSFVEQASRQHPGKVLVAADARHGVVVVEGWVESAQITASDLARRARDWGVAELVFTTVANVGSKHGPDVPGTLELAKKVPEVRVIAAGGMLTPQHLRAAAKVGVAAAIVGRPLCERRFTMADALAAIS